MLQEYIWHGMGTRLQMLIPCGVLLSRSCLVCSLINTCRFPEKWLGGKLDYLFNSHNIMHIMVLICLIPLHLATVADFKWMETAKCPTYL